MTTSKFLPVLTLAVTAMFAGCTVSHTPAPPLQGPSELGLSLTITANPDVLSMDGASQSRINIEARDANGQLLPNKQLRVEISANGQLVDFGSLNARTVVTGSNGQATVIYTAPTAVQGAIPTLQIVVTPAGTDTNAAFPTSRFIAIRLVPPGVIAGPPTASFTVTPPNPAAFTDVLFDASGSKTSLGASIVTYSWDFGDGSSSTGPAVQVKHRFNSSATFRVALTVTDSNGLSSVPATHDVVVGAGVAPRADFTFSPLAPLTNQTVNFNGGISTPGIGHSIARYDWDLGDGRTVSGITVSHAYSGPGTFSVVLTVTDDAGQTALVTKGVTVGASATTAKFSFSPQTPKAGVTLVTFDASQSTAQIGAVITTYDWNFGDNTFATTSSPTITKPTPYATANTYNVRLKVTDSKGASDITIVSVTVVP